MFKKPAPKGHSRNGVKLRRARLHHANSLSAVSLNATPRKAAKNAKSSLALLERERDGARPGKDALRGREAVLASRTLALDAHQDVAPLESLVVVVRVLVLHAAGEHCSHQSAGGRSGSGGQE